MAKRDLTPEELAKVEAKMKTFMTNKDSWVKRYGKDAEKVMRGRAITSVKKETETMNKQKLKELVRKTLTYEADIEVGAEEYFGEKDLSKASMMLDDLETKLKNHDWFYMMSDDNRAYTKGSLEQQSIRNIMKSLEDMGYGEDAKSLFNQYAPNGPGGSTLKMKEAASFSKEYDNNPALKGGQKKLPDALQKSIIKKGAKNEILYNPGEIHGEYEIGDIVKYNGEDHEVTRVEVDRIYIRPVEPSSILGKKDSFWVEKNDLNEDIDLGHEDNEPHMIKGELYQIGKYAMDLYAALEELEEMGGEYDFPAWWQSKITTAKNMISGAKHYLEFEMNEPKIDSAVDALTGEEYHEGEPMMEKKLTKAEKSKKEDIVKGMKKSFKGDESAMYAIATAKAKKVAETLAKKLKND